MIMIEKDVDNIVAKVTFIEPREYSWVITAKQPVKSGRSGYTTSLKSAMEEVEKQIK
jgi:hypothetical protein